MSKAGMDAGLNALLVRHALSNLTTETANAVLDGIEAQLRKSNQAGSADAMRSSRGFLAGQANPNRELPDDEVLIFREHWGRISDLVPPSAFAEDGCGSKIVSDWLEKELDRLTMESDATAANLAVLYDAMALEAPNRSIDRALAWAKRASDKWSYAKEKHEELIAIQRALGDDYDPLNTADTLERAVTRAMDERDDLRIKVNAAKELFDKSDEEATRWEAIAVERKKEIDRLNELLAAKSTPRLPDTGEARVESGETLDEMLSEPKAGAPLGVNPVPSDWPGRQEANPPRVTMAPAGPKVPTVEDAMEVISRINAGESKADIGSFLGFPTNVIIALSKKYKPQLRSLERLAPHEVESRLAEIRRELGAKEVAGRG